MKKYLTVFLIDWQNQFVYRLNFILWRIRNILRLLMTYFLWSGLFYSTRNIFGFTQSQMLSYVFLVLIVQSVVLSAPSADNVGGEIGSGDLSNYLLKPVGYIRYWFVRDLSSKILNLGFAFVEIGLLWLLLRPQFQISTDWLAWLGFLISCGLSVLVYYFLNLSTRFVSFWNPENTWGLSFMVIIFIETLAGLIFPLDVLPAWGKIAVQFTPFPYLVYYPISILLGRITGLYLLQILFQSFIWLLILYFFTRLVWNRGLRVYGSEGR